MLEVIDPGPFTTVQDSGRPGQGHLGVARAGAADALAHAVANALVGNQVGAAAIEMTLAGATFAALRDCMIAFAGADMGAVTSAGESLTPGRCLRLQRGMTLAFGPGRDGARTYVAIGGGVRADTVLGSASNDPVAGFGGLGGRRLRKGDLIEPAAPTGVADPGRAWPLEVPGSGVAFVAGPREIALLPGPHLARMASGTAAALERHAWTVGAHSDRVGLRLEGDGIPAADQLDVASLPMLPGALQVPPGGQPIVLMPDCPTVGGYPVPAVVAAVDRPVLGQLRAGDRIRFVWTDTTTATAWASDLRARFDAIVAAW